MKIETQTYPDLQKIGDLIKGIHIAMLTGIDADDRLVSRPMSVLKMDCNGVFWLFADTNSTTVNQLDLKTSWKFAKHWEWGLGINNVANRPAWQAHTMPQRSVQTELRYSLK